ncbi:MAG: hypothetical protein U0P45_13430 [Acidimicrobiales bacterium]
MLATATLLALQWPPWWTWVAAIVLAVIGGIFATAYATAHHAAVGVTPDDRLLVRPIGAMRLWSLSKGIDVPITAVADVGVEPRKKLLHGWRAPGTYLPGVMIAGTFRSHGDKDLWFVGPAKEVLVIELAAGEAYRHVVVQVEDPNAAVEALRAAMRREHLLPPDEPTA